MKELILSGRIFLIFGAVVVLVAILRALAEKDVTLKEVTATSAALLVSAGSLWLYTGGHVRDGGLLLVSVVALAIYFKVQGVFVMQRYRRREGHQQRP